MNQVAKASISDISYHAPFPHREAGVGPFSRQGLRISERSEITFPSNFPYNLALKSNLVAFLYDQLQ